MIAVTPAMAAEWLRTNRLNRRMRLKTVTRYAEDMKAGRWKASFDPVRFGKSGRLIDGQHRLQAIVLSGVTLTMLVINGVDDDIFDVIDCGAARTFSDALVIEGWEGWQATIGATAAKAALSMMRGLLPTTRNAPNHVVREFVIAHPRLRDSVRFLSEMPRNGVPLQHSSGAALHFLMVEKDADLADVYIRRLYTGENLMAGDTLLNLRNTLIARAMNPNAGSDARTLGAIGAVIKLWNSIRSGKQIKYVNNAFPRSDEPFPEVK